MKQNGARAEPARPADADELGLAPDGRRAGRRRDLARRREGRLHLLRLRVPGRRLLRRPHDDRDHPVRPLRRARRSTASYFHSPSWVDERAHPQLGRLRQPHRTSRTSGPSPQLAHRPGDRPRRRRADADGRQARRGARLRQLDAHRLVLGRRQRAVRAQAAGPDRDLRDRRAGRLRPAHWAPDGNQVAWSEPDGIWIHRDAAGCETQQPHARAARRLGGRLGPGERQPRRRARRRAAVGSRGGRAAAARRRRRRRSRRRPPLRWRSRSKAPAGKLRVSGRLVKVKIGCAAGCAYDAKLSSRAGCSCARRARRRRVARASRSSCPPSRRGRCASSGVSSKALRLVVAPSRARAAATRSAGLRVGRVGGPRLVRSRRSAGRAAALLLHSARPAAADAASPQWPE